MQSSFQDHQEADVQIGLMGVQYRRPLPYKSARAPWLRGNADTGN